MRKALATCIVTAAILFMGTQSASAQDEKPSLKGTWQLTEFDEGRGAYSAEELKGATVEFTDDTMTLSMPALREAKIPLKYKLVDGEPAGIDVASRPGPEETEFDQGMYKIEDDSLRMSIDRRDGQGRPKELIKGVRRVVYMAMKRAEK